MLAAGHDGQVKVWHTADATVALEYTVQPDLLLGQRNNYHFISARFHPDDDKFAVGDNHGYMHVVAFPSGEVLQRFNRSGHKVEVIDWTPDGQYLVVAGQDPFIRFFRTADILSGDRIYSALEVHAGDQAESLHFNRTGSLMASAHQDGAIRLWIVMSEDPTVNARRHQEVKRQQAEAAGQRGQGN